MKTDKPVNLFPLRIDTAENGYILRAGSIEARDLAIYVFESIESLDAFITKQLLMLAPPAAPQTPGPGDCVTDHVWSAIGAAKPEAGYVSGLGFTEFGRRE